VPYRSIGNQAQAAAAADQLGYPVALKSLDESLRHRIDRSGVRLDLHDADQVTAAYHDLSLIAGPRLSVQAMAPRDRADVSTELLDDRAYRAVPLTDVDAAELIAAPRAVPLLNGYWGARVIARGPLIELALRLSQLADELPEVSDLELRPVRAGPVGVAVTSGTCRIGPALAQPHVKRRLH
jgi:hypothetical protein